MAATEPTPEQKLSKSIDDLGDVVRRIKLQRDIYENALRQITALNEHRDDIDFVLWTGVWKIVDFADRALKRAEQIS